MAAAARRFAFEKLKTLRDRILILWKIVGLASFQADTHNLSRVISHANWTKEPL
jgi:hypothetical protein